MKELQPAGHQSGEDINPHEFDRLLTAKDGASLVVPTQRIDGVVVGTLVGLNDNGTTPLVTFHAQREDAAIPARATIDLSGRHIGRAVLLTFEAGDSRRPIIIGCLREGSTSEASVGRVEVDADGERLIVAANQGLVLRCGKASITLSPDGKIVVRGTHIVSHASGVNRIKGGSVQVN